ncbi:3-oxoacyl-ACP reductase FabG [Microbacterium sp. RD1]|uniref:3-oxoacyl-ACP reductase FabG n=1 Tax=Microbacterium sp. RD1 TaxID=3457313 RepID=UPI003FA6117A
MSAPMLEGRTAVITGAADGLGWAMAQRFASEGARIVVADLRADLARQRVNALREGGAEASFFAVDVTDEAAVDALFAHAGAEFGGVDVLCNNAGVTRDSVLRKMSLDDFRLVLDVHLQGAWLCTRAAVASMRDTGSRGSIINMSSIAGKVGNPGQTNYSTAKAGMVGLTKATAKEVARYGIRVNAIAPGLIRTAMTEQMDQAVLAESVASVPLGRIGEPGDVADVALFLASDLSSYMTGCLLEVTGGRHM